MRKQTLMRKGKLHVITKEARGARSGQSPVLLVHGAWHGAWCWEGNFLDYFADCGFDTHAIDLRGHGKSPAQKPMRWNCISDYVDDVLSVVAEFDHAPIVIGHSMGGFVVQKLMQRTRRISRVGLLATVPAYGASRATLDIALKRPLDFAKVNLLWSLYPLVRDPSTAKHMFLDEDTPAASMFVFTRRLTDESYLGFLDMLVLDLPRGDANGIPTLVVGGEKDNLFTPGSQQTTARRYRAECKIVPDAPHDLMLSKHWRDAADHFIEWMRSE